MEDMESKSFTFCEEQYIEYFWVYEMIKLMYYRNISRTTLHKNANQSK